MSAPAKSLSADDYDSTLLQFLKTRGEEPLYRASQLSQNFIESGLGPEDIVALHCDALDRILEDFSYREKARAMSDAHQFLLEMMIAYGVKYKEYLELKLEHTLHDAEARLARERDRAMEMERLQREKSEILGVIAHELRTPITAATGNLELAAKWLAQGRVESIPGILVATREALNRLARLTGDLVEASRGDPPRLEMQPQDLLSILEQTCAWARPTAYSRGVALTHESKHEDEKIVIPGDTDALLSLFGNILSNAVRYTPSGGQINISQRVDGNWAIVEIRDTGIGMTPEVQARIFEKFYRSSEAREQEAGGLGLGLTLVQQMVQAHHGRIEVESSPGQGSTFRVFLPISQ